jgi:Domain of unknown function (DUF4136)
MRSVLALLALLVPVAATAQTVKVDYDAKVDFSRYKTFAWSEAQQHAKNPANHIRITRATERELEAKGLQKAESGPADLRVRYYSKIEKKLKSSSRQESGTWQPNDLRTVVDVSRVDQGTLILELSDGESRAVVWRGTAVGVAPRPDLVAEVIDASVKKIVAAYPPKPAPAP